MTFISLEDEFVEVARNYAEKKGISYATWREAGAPAAVPGRAGISKSESQGIARTAS
jgi:hypothetical protein